MDLAEAGYLKQRLTPQPGDFLYLHLSDLLIALKVLIPTHVSLVLDYGCGGSAYRPLFGNCTYHRADLSGGSNLDFEYCPDAKWLRSASHELVNLLPRLAESVLIVDPRRASKEAVDE